MALLPALVAVRRAQWLSGVGAALAVDCLGRYKDTLTDRTGCERHLSLAAMDREQRHTLAATREAATAAGVAVIDVRDVLCADDKCGTSRDGVGLYSDSAHLTPAGANKLKPRFVDFMAHPPR